MKLIEKVTNSTLRDLRFVFIAVAGLSTSRLTHVTSGWRFLWMAVVLVALVCYGHIREEQGRRIGAEDKAGTR